MRDLLSLSAAGVRRFALAAVLVVAAMAGLAPAPASAQWFEVPQGFISVPGATTAPGSPPAVAGLEPITGIRPESGAFSDLSGIALYAVIDPVDDPDDGRTRPAAWAGLIGYWVFGLPLGAWLAFSAGSGIAGIWTGLAIGLAGVAVALLLRVLFGRLDAPRR